MRFFVKGCLLAIVILLLIPHQTFAHPLDQTYTTVYLHTDSLRSLLPDNTIKAETYISWQEMSYIHEKYTGKKIDAANFDSQIKVFYTDPKPHRNYISENIEVKNNGEDCDITTLSEKKYSKDEVLIGKGVGINMTIVCPAAIAKIEFLNRMFLDDFPYQTHEVTLYSYNKLVATDQLTKDNLTIAYPPPDPVQDSEEPAKNSNFLATMFTLFTNNIANPNFATFAALFIIGFVHSLEGGHSKTLILISTGSSKKKVKDMLYFVATFVVTHVADILLLSGILLLAKPVINAYVLASVIEKYSLYALAIITCVMLIKSILDYKKKTIPEDHDAKHHLKNDLAIAFLTGLAPCALGWTIFTLILSSGLNSVNTILYIVVFAAGIATALIAIYSIGSKITGKIIGKFDKLSKLAPIITYGILALVAVTRLLL